jgi:hypothetical protein
LGYGSINTPVCQTYDVVIKKGVLIDPVVRVAFGTNRGVHIIFPKEGIIDEMNVNLSN